VQRSHDGDDTDASCDDSHLIPNTSAGGRATIMTAATSVVDRTLLILSTFHEDCERLTLSDISRRSELPIATCHRIVQRLTAWGALERDQEHRYRIGLWLWEVASRAPRSVGLQRVARPYLLGLHEITGYGTHLTIRSGTELVSIEKFQKRNRASHNPIVGERYPLHATASGQVLLAYAPEGVRDEVITGRLQSFTQNTCTDPVALERIIMEVRQNGYAVSDRQMDTRHITVAAPVRDVKDRVVAALSILLTEDDADDKNMIHLVRLTARSVSRALKAMGFDEPV
jgi:DNA-binding IclR family transcriptional regulator